MVELISPERCSKNTFWWEITKNLKKSFKKKRIYSILLYLRLQFKTVQPTEYTCTTF